MDRNGILVECDNSGAQASWAITVVNGQTIKTLPEGWVELPETKSGPKHFANATQMEAWKASREWELPIQSPSLTVGTVKTVTIVANPIAGETRGNYLKRMMDEARQIWEPGTPNPTQGEDAVSEAEAP